MSGGKVDFKFTILPSYVRIPSKSDKYGLGKWSSGDVGSYIQDAIKAGDPSVQFDKFDVFYFLSPRQIPWASIAYGPAILAPMPTEDGNIQNITFSGADAYQDFPGADWKWISHETGHLFGLHDLYVNGGDPTYGAWDIMSLNWSTAAIELNAWNRYIQGWLSDSQINCLQLSKPETTEITLSPIEREDSLTKATVVKISDSKILVIESRRSEGLDVLSAEQSGTLVYTVDMKIGSIKGGWKTQRRPGSNNEDFIDSALKVGDKITAEGVTIEVLSQTDAGDRIKISY
jgi:M6 family metalloprotease-like protein